MKKLFLLFTLLLSGCTGVPQGIKPVAPFELSRYLGKWYEIARLDHRFERGLNNISAEYSLNDSGGIKVINSGYEENTGKLKQAEGKAYFIGDKNIGSLKVSFFGPFYGGYHIIDLDHQAYQYAMISGPDRDYLWILSRTPQLDSTILKRLIAKAKTLGFAVDQLIYPVHRR